MLSARGFDAADGETRRVVGITALSKSQASIMARDLDEQVESFRTRPQDPGPYTFVAADALVPKMRENGRVMNVHTLLAVGINRDGHREILDIDVSSGEDKAGWLTFFRGLVARGLSGVKLVTSGAHAGARCGDRRDIARGVVATLPNALCGELDVDHPESVMAVGEDHAAFDLRSTRPEKR